MGPAARIDGEGGAASAPGSTDAPGATDGPADGKDGPRRRRRKRSGGGATAASVDAAPPDAAPPDEAALALSAEAQERRRGRERNGRPVGRYLMVVHTQPQATQIAVLEGRTLIRHVVSRPNNDTSEIDGNIYLARVQNVLPGMEAAFVDIGTPKNAVLYRGDLRFDADSDDIDGKGKGKKDDLRIEQVLKAGQVICCQVTKNPIAHKGARLTQDVSLPGRFVVLVPNSDTYGISKRLPDDERKRLRRILDGIRPPGHGIIVRTAAEGCSDDELRRDVARLVEQWNQIEALAKRSKAPSLLHREPDIAVRFIREELNKEFRSVIFDDPGLHAEVLSYVTSINPELADRIELHDPTVDPLPLFERHHVHEQLHKAVDRKVWLPSGGSLIIERTEALTVIDVNTGKNVGKTNLEETVFRNNLEAADEIARQLRLRDIGGIIVIDFIDMEVKANRDEVARRFRQALARDKTRVQVFDISELGLIEMTRKRISEGLVESLSETCPVCAGRGFTLASELME
jgi:ribonuclease E